MNEATEILAQVPRGRMLVIADLDGTLLDAAGAGPREMEPEALAASGALALSGLEELGSILGAGPLEAAVLTSGESTVYLLPSDEDALLVGLGAEVRNPVAALRQAIDRTLPAARTPR